MANQKWRDEGVCRKVRKNGRNEGSNARVMDNPTGEVRAYKIDQRTRIIRLYLLHVVWSLSIMAGLLPFIFLPRRTRSITLILLLVATPHRLVDTLFSPSCSMTTVHGRLRMEILPWNSCTEQEKLLVSLVSLRYESNHVSPAILCPMYRYIQVIAVCMQGILNLSMK